MTVSDKQSIKALIAWSNKTLGEDPEFEGETAKVEFSFKVSGRYPVECVFIAQEPISMLTISVYAYLAIKSEKADQVLGYCAENNNAAGLFSVVEGSLVYVHSRSAAAESGGDGLCRAMVSQANSAVGSVAEGVLAILKA